MSEDDRSDLRAYAALSYSTALGFIRLYSARIASNTFLIAVRTHQLAKNEGKRSQFAESSGIDALSPKEFDSFRYVSNISYLVYSTSLLDTFLTETTKFLILRYPSVLGDDHVQLRRILDAPSKQEIVNSYVANKAKVISYRSFLDRIDYFRRTFGLRIELEAESSESLSHFAGLRNVIVHDQSVFEFALDDNMRCVARQKTCPVHPTPVSDEELQSAWHAYGNVIKEVCLAVASQVLNGDGSPEMDALMKVVQEIPPT